jgi:hypothetical protein
MENMGDQLNEEEPMMAKLKSGVSIPQSIGLFSSLK